MALLHWRKTDVPNRVRWGQWNQFFLPLFSFFLHFFFPFWKNEQALIRKNKKSGAKKVGYLTRCYVTHHRGKRNDRMADIQVSGSQTSFSFFFYSFVMSQVCRVCATNRFSFFFIRRVKRENRALKKKRNVKSQLLRFFLIREMSMIYIFILTNWNIS